MSFHPVGLLRIEQQPHAGLGCEANFKGRIVKQQIATVGRRLQVVDPGKSFIIFRMRMAAGVIARRHAIEPKTATQRTHGFAQYPGGLMQGIIEQRRETGNTFAIQIEILIAPGDEMAAVAKILCAQCRDGLDSHWIEGGCIWIMKHMNRTD